MRITWIKTLTESDDDGDTKEIWPIRADYTPVIVTMIDHDDKEWTGILRGGAQWRVMKSWGWREKGGKS